MIAAARRGVALGVFSALWATPDLLPFHSLGVSLVGRVGGVRWGAPQWMTLAEGRHDAAPGWYVALALGTFWPLIVVWNALAEVPAREMRRGAKPHRAWIAALVGGAFVAAISWVLWPMLCFLCVNWEGITSAVRVHHFALVDAGVAVALPAWLVLASRAAGKPIDVARTPLHRWAAGVALFLFVTPPFLLLAKSGQLILYALATLTMWVRELPALEETSPLGRTRIRVAAILLGSLPLVPAALFSPRVHPLVVAPTLPLVHAGVALVVAGAGLVFVALCMTAADGLAWTLQRAPSVRTRMLVLGLSSAALAFLLAGVYVPVTIVGEEAPSLVLTLVGKLVCVAIVVVVFSATLSRKFARSLEQSVRAIGEIQRGNLDVALDEAGDDEVAAMSRSFNELARSMRKAEFLEQLNADLRERGAQLATTLAALQTAQADLVRSERMASVAVLVKGIAHELNNPINYIAGNVAPLQRYCEFLTRAAIALSDGRPRSPEELFRLTHLTERKDLAFVVDDLARLAADIGEGARRAHLIISDLQGLTSAAQRGVERVDLGRVVRQTIALLEPSVRPGVTLAADLSSSPILAARAGQLEQVLVNLTDNALRAVGDRGEVRISVAANDGHAIVRVVDDGPGMSDEVRRQAFEPFFTTRAAGEGSGLGLAIVASIVRAHHGTVTLESAAGKGTRVELRLPLESDLSPAADALADRAYSRRGS
jgi:signal transduction histidine kinase